MSSLQGVVNVAEVSGQAHKTEYLARVQNEEQHKHNGTRMLLYGLYWKYYFSNITFKICLKFLLRSWENLSRVISFQEY